MRRRLSFDSCEADAAQRDGSSGEAEAAFQDLSLDHQQEQEPSFEPAQAESHEQPNPNLQTLESPENNFLGVEETQPESSLKTGDADQDLIKEKEMQPNQDSLFGDLTEHELTDLKAAADVLAGPQPSLRTAAVVSRSDSLALEEGHPAASSSSSAAPRPDFDLSQQVLAPDEGDPSSRPGPSRPAAGPKGPHVHHTPECLSSIAPPGCSILLNGFLAFLSGFSAFDLS